MRRAERLSFSLSRLVLFLHSLSGEHSVECDWCSFDAGIALRGAIERRQLGCEVSLHAGHRTVVYSQGSSALLSARSRVKSTWFCGAAFDERCRVKNRSHGHEFQPPGHVTGHSGACVRACVLVRLCVCVWTMFMVRLKMLTLLYRVITRVKTLQVYAYVWKDFSVTSSILAEPAHRPASHVGRGRRGWHADHPKLYPVSAQWPYACGCRCVLHAEKRLSQSVKRELLSSFVEERGHLC